MSGSGCESLLHLDGTVNSLNWAAELDQKAIARRLHNPAMMLGNPRAEDYVGCENGGKASLDG
jgi:hypothetical protein